MLKPTLFLWLWLSVHFADAQNDSSLIILLHDNVIDGISMKPLKDASITIQNGRITNIQKQDLKPVENAIVMTSLASGCYQVI
jgi:hypothetical protein